MLTPAVQFCIKTPQPPPPYSQPLLKNVQQNEKSHEAICCLPLLLLYMHAWLCLEVHSLVEPLEVQGGPQCPRGQRRLAHAVAPSHPGSTRQTPDSCLYIEDIQYIFRERSFYSLHLQVFCQCRARWRECKNTDGVSIKETEQT